MKLAHAGWSAPIHRAKFEHWVPFNFDYRAVQVNAASQEEMRQEEAERRHVLAVVCGGVPVSQTSNAEKAPC